MSYKSFLAHTATIERKTGAQDASGQVIGTSTVLYQNIPCRLVEFSEREAAPGMAAQPIYRHFLMVQASVDVEPGDVVSQIVLEDGKTDGPYIIREAITRRDRKKARLVRLNLEKV